MKKRLYNKQYILTRQGRRLANETAAFVSQLVSSNQTVDPHDLRDVVSQAIELALLRYELDTQTLALRKTKRNKVERSTHAKANGAKA